VGLPPAEARLKKRAFGAAGHNRGSAAEVVRAAESARQAAGAGRLSPDLPVAVVAAGPLGEGAWDRAKAEPGRTSRSGSIEAVAGASHASVLGEAHADVVARAVLRVLAASSSEAGIPRG
jgi:hypothetical protein